MAQTDDETETDVQHTVSNRGSIDLALEEPMMVELLADCAEAMVKRAEQAERTILGLAHQLEARGAGASADTRSAAPSEANTVIQAAHNLGVDRNTLYEMLKRGDGPPSRRCGTTYRLDAESVREWLRGGDAARARRSR